MVNCVGCEDESRDILRLNVPQIVALCPRHYAAFKSAKDSISPPVPKHSAGSRVPINIDPAIREALCQHLMTRYAGTGVGYSEFIRRALTWDLADNVPEQVTPDNRWSGTWYPGDDEVGLMDGPNGRNNGYTRKVTT